MGQTAVVSGAVALLLGAGVLAVSVRSLVVLLRAGMLQRLPLADEQHVLIDSPGDVVLHLEGPRFARPIAFPWTMGGDQGPRFVLRDVGVGQNVPSSAPARTRVAGFGRARVAVRRFAVNHTGTYSLVVEQFPSGLDPGAFALVLTRPFATAMVALILAIVLGGLLLLGGLTITLVGSILR